MSPLCLRCKDSCLYSTLGSLRSPFLALLSWLRLIISSVSLPPPLIHTCKDTSVNLQIAELEQHIYGITDIGRDEGPMYHIYISHSRSSFSFMWGLLTLAPIIVHCVAYIGSIIPLDDTSRQWLWLYRCQTLTRTNHFFVYGRQQRLYIYINWIQKEPVLRCPPLRFWQVKNTLALCAWQSTFTEWLTHTNVGHNVLL